MTNFRAIVGLFLIFSLITGCNAIKTKEDDLLFHTIAELQYQVDEEEWEQALLHIKEFERKYEHRKWKLQLLGEIDDYKEIELETKQLIEAIKEEDKLEAKVGLSHIKHRLNIIYHL